MAFDFGAALTSAGQLYPAADQARQNIIQRQREAQQFALSQRQGTAQAISEEQRNKQWVPMRSYTSGDGSQHTVYFTPQGIQDLVDQPSPLDQRKQYIDTLKKMGISLPPEEIAQFTLTGGYRPTALLKPLTGEAGKPFKGADGQWYVKEQNAEGQLVDVPLGPNYQPPSAQMSDYQQKLLDLRKAEDAFKNNPNSPYFKLRLAQASTAALRAKAYDLNAQSGAFGSYNGVPLAGAGLTTDDRTIGSKFFGGYIKTQQSMAQLNDARGAVGNVDAALDKLYNSGSSLLQPNVAEALSNRTWTSAKIMQGIVASTLTPEEREAVTAIKSAQENIQGMRKAAGGGLSNEQVNRLEAQLPGPNTPDYEYAKSQIKYLNLTLDRLGEGVPAAVGGHTMAPSPTAGSGGSQSAKKHISLIQARQLPQFRGKSDDVITAAAQKLGYEVDK